MREGDIMKILFASGNLCNGGAQRVISIVSSYLAEKGYDVHLLLFSRNEKEYPISEKVKITSIGNNYEEYSKISLMERIRFIRKLLKKLKPDIGIGFLEGGYALQLASCGIKYKRVASARINPQYILSSKSFRGRINRMWFGGADKIVLQTKSQFKMVPETWKERSCIIANPVSELALNNKCELYEKNCRRFIMVGRLEQQKNYPMAFKAIEIVKEKYPDVHLDVFGKGALESSLQQMIDQKGLADQITMRGWTQNALEEYTKHDLFLMTSDYEGMPNALMEAMAVGLPCVSTDCETGPSDLINDGENGYLVPVNDAEKFAQRIIDIIEMPLDGRIKMADLAHITMRDYFNVDVICKQWETMLNDLIKE